MALLEIENLQTHFRTPDGINRAVDGLSLPVAEQSIMLATSRASCSYVRVPDAAREIMRQW